MTKDELKLLGTLIVEQQAQIRSLWDFVGHLVSNPDALKDVTPENWPLVVTDRFEKRKEQILLEIGDKQPLLAEWLGLSSYGQEDKSQ